MSEEREISLQSVGGNALDKLDAMNPGEEGYSEAYKAVDILVKNANEAEQIESNERIEMAKIEAEKAQHAEENRLKEKELKYVLIGDLAKSIGVALIVETSCHIGTKVVAKFEESGTWRSLASKLWIGRFGKKK